MGKDYDADSLLVHVNTDKDTHKDKYKDKDKRRTFPRKQGSCIRHSYIVLQYNYINVIFQIIFAKTKTKTRWDPSEFCTVYYV